jgi:hypothetical protein
MLPKFSADSIGGQIEYDFTTWGGSAGVIPEPSRKAVKHFMDSIQRGFKEIGLRNADDPDATTPDEVVDTMNKIEDDEVFEKTAEMLTKAVAEVCGGSPSFDELASLHYRPFMGFFGYLIGELMNPEVSRPGTNTTRRLRSV